MTKYPPIEKIECSDEFYIPNAKCKLKVLKQNYCECCIYFTDCKEEEFNIKRLKGCRNYE